jgi:hypothetical protein
MKNLDEYKKKPGLKKRSDKVTTINLTLSQWIFLKENNIDFSKLVRAYLQQIMSENNKKEV